MAELHVLGLGLVGRHTEEVVQLVDELVQEGDLPPVVLDAVAFVLRQDEGECLAETGVGPLGSLEQVLDQLNSRGENASTLARTRGLLLVVVLSFFSLLDLVHGIMIGRLFFFFVVVLSFFSLLALVHGIMIGRLFFFVVVVLVLVLVIGARV
jgi:hypothetical protein